MTSTLDQDTRSRILAEAAALFGERGYGSTTIKSIAERVGITPGAVYWHFPSKEAILFAYLDARVDELVSAVEEALPDGPAADRLAALVRAQVLVNLHHSAEQDELAIYGIAHLAKVLDPEQYGTVVERQKQHLERVRSILAAGVAEGAFRADLDVTPTAFAILTMCDFITIWYRPGGRLDPEAAAAVYADLALAMVRP